MRICALGLGSDSTVTHFVRVGRELGWEITFVDLFDLVRDPWQVAVAAGGTALATGPFTEEADGALRLDARHAYYVRPVDLSPVLAQDDARRWRHLAGAVTAFLDNVPSRVVNRPSGHAHNGSKPLHEWWLRQAGFPVPPSVSTSDPAQVAAFLDVHGEAVVKGLSGGRGTAQRVTRESFSAYSRANGPVHLQQVVDGYDVRVHAVEGSFFVERIDSEGTDYRSEAVESHHRPYHLPADVASAVSLASSRMALPFTGWDFRVDAEGTWWCLEANPMPGYSWYDRRAGGAITDALCRTLTGARP